MSFQSPYDVFQIPASRAGRRMKRTAEGVLVPVYEILNKTRPSGQVSVSNTGSGSVISSPSPDIKVVTVTNLDSVNAIHLSVGFPITSTSQGDILPPKASAFYAVALGDNPQDGIYALAENAAVNVWITPGVSKGLVPV